MPRKQFVIIILFFVSLLVFNFAINRNSVMAAQQYAVYTAPDGFEIISYCSAWSETVKLKGVYDELNRNTHGEEFKLLRRVSIFPGQDPQGRTIAGRWFGQWKTKNGVPILEGNRYIEIYDGQRLTTVEGIARTLAHEYGHHFTYYYYFKQEKKVWKSWRSSGLAVARGLNNNNYVSTNTADHKWLIEEIAAEDYVQLFGSLTAKRSYDFKDISERLTTDKLNTVFNTDIYNFCPQENREIPLAANLPKVKEYWLKASKLPGKVSNPPSQINLELEDVQKMPHGDIPQYIFAWDKSVDGRATNLEYTLVHFEKNNNEIFDFEPIKTVSGNEPLKAVLGAAMGSNMILQENVPTDIGYFVVYIKDQNAMITSSKILAVDFNPNANLDSVLIDINSLLNQVWFPPRVKINNKQLTFDVSPIIQDGRVLVPLRIIFEELGATVAWDPRTKTVTAGKGGVNITLNPGLNTAIVNTQSVLLDAPPQIINGRVLVPLRFVSEALGAQASWNSKLQLASIKQ